MCLAFQYIVTGTRFTSHTQNCLLSESQNKEGKVAIHGFRTTPHLIFIIVLYLIEGAWGLFQMIWKIVVESIMQNLGIPPFFAEAK